VISTHLYFCAAVVLLLWTVLLWLAELFTGSAVTRMTRPRTLVLGAAALGLAVLPLGEFTLWRWLMSAHANPSLMLIGFLTAFVGRRLTRRAWLSDRERLTAYLIGFAVGSTLYVSATGYFGPDLYAKAWESHGVVVVTGLLAAALLLAGNRIGILLVAALAAYVLDVLESDNAWDYLIDPAFWLLSVGGLARYGLGAAIRRFKGGPNAPASSITCEQSVPRSGCLEKAAKP
jgi:hypothetical protein